MKRNILGGFQYMTIIATDLDHKAWNDSQQHATTKYS